SRDGVTEALERLMKDRIVFVITHQPSILPSGARQLHVNRGRVEEEKGGDIHGIAAGSRSG
ncbi:MAG TPA: hypothetical protein VM598_04650, partial [Bdellovibrionota bacterium]|nr:hypothetical protein [Bdellovibrionota bacterium]